MTNTQSGWLLGVAAIGMLFGLLALDISQLNTWEEMRTPLFIGTFLGHLASIIAAFVGGKIIPTKGEV